MTQEVLAMFVQTSERRGRVSVHYVPLEGRGFEQRIGLWLGDEGNWRGSTEVYFAHDHERRHHERIWYLGASAMSASRLG